ncbi:MAG: heavy metal sensor histidine kinase [Methylococcales bacterium]|nr:heavy metal sensor histidine kinase [Methylococcales bacterium]
MNNATKSPPQQSLASKLAILYAVTTFSVLLIASGLLYWSVLGHLHREHHNLLSAKITDLRAYFKTSAVFNETLSDLIDVEHHHSQMPHSSAIHPGIPHHVFVRILDNQNNLLVESAAMLPLPSSLKFPIINKNNPDDITIIKVKSEDNQLFLLGSTWVITQNNNQPSTLLLHAVLELAPDETLLSEYHQTLSGVLLFGVLASGLAGFLITRRGLRPLHKITESIQNINAHQLNERVDSEQWPREIALLAKAFDKMLGRLDQSFGQLSQFSADLAHELRTPVNNLMGASEVALSRNRDAEEYRAILESNMEEYSRIARMIDELLFLARAENQKTEVNCAHLKLEDEFQAIKDFYEGLASDQQVNIVCNANQTNLYADPSLLRRILSNLISNALRYTKSQGSITLSAKHSSSYTVTITISDTGEGISPDFLPHIFDRFFRADKSRHRDNQGSGLGLAIVKSIMDLHGGNISISSQLGQGTTVQIRFPMTLN